MEYILDGRQMTDKESVHSYIIEQIEIPYGNNLDALYDILTTASNATIIFENTDIMLENLGHYGYVLLKVMKDAEMDNEGLTLEIK